MRSLYLAPALNQALIYAFSDRDQIDKGLETKEKYSPQEGIELVTYRVQARPATHCAIWAKRSRSCGEAKWVPGVHFAEMHFFFIKTGRSQFRYSLFPNKRSLLKAVRGLGPAAILAPFSAS